MTSQQRLKPWCILAITFSILNFSNAAGETKLWINEVPKYSLLPVCAENPVSNIVRGMVSGCGDSGQLTSFNCFCSDSSSQFDGIISTAVESKCGRGSNSEVNLALDVFASYCRLEVSTTAAAATSQGISATPSPSSTLVATMLASYRSSSQSQTASSTFMTTPAPTLPSSAAFTATASSTNSAAVSVSSANNSAKIAVGVCIPLAALGLAIGAYFYLRSRRAHARAHPTGTVPMGQVHPIYSNSQPPPGTSHSATPLHPAIAMATATAPPPDYEYYKHERGPQPRDGGLSLSPVLTPADMGQWVWMDSDERRRGSAHWGEGMVNGRMAPVEIGGVERPREMA